MNQLNLDSVVEENANEYKLTVTYQPMNKCWGVKVKKGNIVANLVDENLLTALQQMGEYILQVRELDSKK